MDAESAFADIRKNIAEGRTDMVAPAIMELAESDGDPITLIKCMSLLKVIDDRETSKRILGMLMERIPEDREMAFQIANALRSLGYPSSALSVAKDMDRDDRTVRIAVSCLIDLEEYEEALDWSGRIAEPTPFDRVMLTEIYSAIGEHSDAISIAEGLLKEYPDNYQVRKAYVSALIVAGKDKDAIRYARTSLKDKTADSNSIAAYVLRIAGNTKAAAGYATRAINIDNGHIGAMETLGICLALKGEYDKARIVAGAINEKSPGDKAALNILGYCEGH